MEPDPTPGGETYADLADRLLADPTELAKWLEKAPEGIDYDFARRKLAEAKLKQAEAERDALKAAAKKTREAAQRLQEAATPSVAAFWSNELLNAALAIDGPTETPKETS